LGCKDTGFFDSGKVEAPDLPYFVIKIIAVIY
jgi:hypothetical protein